MLKKDKEKPGYGYRKGRGASSFLVTGGERVAYSGRWRKKDSNKADAAPDVTTVVSTPSFTVDIKDINAPIVTSSGELIIGSVTKSRVQKRLPAATVAKFVADIEDKTPNETTVKAIQESEILFKMLSAIS